MQYQGCSRAHLVGWSSRRSSCDGAHASIASSIQRNDYNCLNYNAQAQMLLSRVHTSTVLVVLLLSCPNLVVTYQYQYHSPSSLLYSSQNFVYQWVSMTYDI